MKENRSRVFWGCVSAVMGGVCWGISGTCSQYLFSHFDITSLELTCMRLLGCGIVLSIIALLRHGDQLRDIWKHPRDVGRLAVYGIGGLLLCNYAYSTGIYYSNAATTTVLQTLSVAIIMVIACLQSRRKPKWHEVLACIMALLGTYLLVTGGDPGQMILSPQGLFWGLATAVGATMYTMVGRPLLQRWNQDVILGIAMVMGGVTVNLLARSWTLPFALHSTGWLAVGATIALGSAAFFLFLQGIRDAGPVRASILSVAEPVTAALLGVLWLGDSFSAAELLGFAAILAIVFLLAKSE